MDLFRVLLDKELKVRYKSTILGFLWSLANPIAFALVFYVAFKFVMRFDMENYLVFLLVALFPWQWFANTISGSPTLFLLNVPLIKKVQVPRIFFPLTLTANHLIHFFLALLIFIPILALHKYYPAPIWIIGIPLLLVLQTAITIGLCTIIANLNVLFRDLEHLTSIFVQLLFWFTPIIYPASVIPEKYRPLFYLNPMYAVIESWRNLMMEGWMDWKLVGMAAISGAVFSGAGYFLHRRLEWRLAESI